MTMFGPLGFAFPLALLAGLALPLIWLVVRAIPPSPQDTIFPPADILRTLPKTEETPAKAPPWLAIVRALALAFVILGLSGPVLNPPKVADTRPLLLVIDNGWSAGPLWSQMTDEATAAARGASGEVRILFTAPLPVEQANIEALLPARAAASLSASAPQPILADHSASVSRLAGLPNGQRIIWFSDNVARPGTVDLARALSRLGSVKMRVIASPAVGITRVEPTSQGYNLGLIHAAAASDTAVLQALDAKSRVIGEADVARNGSGVSLPIAAALTSDVAALRVGGARSAGGVFLLDAFDRRVRTGLVAARQDDQPLLSDAHYLEEALRPYAEITRGDIERLATSGLDAILLPDAAALPAREEKALEDFVSKGGILVRFAGPRLVSAGQSITLPAAVAPEPRALRGALAWDSAGAIGAFDRGSPFAGLTVPNDARINQIAVFAPDLAGASTNAASKPQIWARMADSTPLVSAAPLGRGWRVLFHTTAGPAWSDVAFSGLQVSMLRRVLAKSASSALPANAVAPTAPLKPVLVLDGFGNLRAPDSQYLSIAPQNVVNARPDARHPPGIYEGGGSRLILQAARPDTVLPALPLLPGVERVTRASEGPYEWGPPLLTLGVIMIVLDIVLAMIFAGSWKLPTRVRWLKTAAVAVAVAGLAMSALPSASQAQSLPEFPPLPQIAPSQQQQRQQQRGPGDLSLAYIRTGDAATDARARAGLEGLSRVLAARTSVEPGPVVALDPSKDDLALFPLLYWLLPDRPTETSGESARALDRFMKSGGVLFVDSRGAGREPSAARAIARAALRGIEAPPLEPVPEGHVLTKAFYILRAFPGRYQNARLWVETSASAAASANDGVSPLIVGDGDWASAWATATPLVQYGVSNVTQRNQEIAARVGVNVVLYALTGNYKADQVHFEALLKRLGPR
jgi:Domain of unknown function (DUF4159)/Aerotolerance regulator N-terminal